MVNYWNLNKQIKGHIPSYIVFSDPATFQGENGEDQNDREDDMKSYNGGAVDQDLEDDEEDEDDEGEEEEISARLSATLTVTKTASTQGEPAKKTRRVTKKKPIVLSSDDEDDWSPSEQDDDDDSDFEL